MVFPRRIFDGALPGVASTTSAALSILGALALAGGRMIGRLGTTPATFTPVAGAATLDASASNDFQQATSAITQATLLTLANGVDGDQGTVSGIQDGTGFAVTFAAAGRQVRYFGTIPSGPNEPWKVHYQYVTVNAVAYLDIVASIVPS